MRVPRCSFPPAAALMAVLGASTLLLGGCSDDPKPDAVTSEVDEKEQAFLQERIQKGISKSPVQLKKPGK